MHIQLCEFFVHVIRVEVFSSVVVLVTNKCLCFKKNIYMLEALVAAPSVEYIWFNTNKRTSPKKEVPCPKEVGSVRPNYLFDR